MNIDWTLLLEIVIPMGVMFALIWSRLDKRFNNVDEAFCMLRNDVSSINMRLGILETRFKERAPRLVKMGKSEESKVSNK